MNLNHFPEHSIPTTAVEKTSSQKTDLMFLISIEGLSKGRLAEYLSAQSAISPKTLKPILVSNDVLATVRKEIKRKTKHNIDPKELKSAVEKLLGM